MVQSNGHPPSLCIVDRLDPRWSDRRDLVSALRSDLQRLVALDHPHLATDAVLTRLDGQLAVVRNASNVADLAHLLEAQARGQLTIPSATSASIGRTIASALDAASARGLLHGQLEPGVVTLDERGVTQVYGFGLARPELPSWTPETGSLKRIRLDETAPEQLARARFDPSFAADIYALGAILAALWRGRPMSPARMRRDEHAAMVAERLDEVIPPTSTSAAETLRTLMARMLSFDPVDRPTATSVAARLQALIPELDGPSVGEWAAAEVPSWTLDPETVAPSAEMALRSPLVETPMDDADDDETAIRPALSTFPIDPGATQDPLTANRQAQWVMLRAESLKAITSTTPHRKSPEKVFRRDVSPDPQTPRRVGGIALAITGGAIFAGALVLGLAAIGAITTWGLRQPNDPRPVTEFRSGSKATPRMTVRCDAAEATGLGRVRLYGPGLGRCSVVATGEAREQRTAVIPDVRPGTYLCFAVDDDGCVAMTPR